ncbi:gustatory receptor 5a for trehalose isoform X6 [Megachile rotundata]|uniref:gustatory receptor 5a for trehalose isoform X6 n=1 Tax=Megachile rotundata TaxID=143995 RepID=UPI003FD11D50
MSDYNIAKTLSKMRPLNFPEVKDQKILSINVGSSRNNLQFSKFQELESNIDKMPEPAAPPMDTFNPETDSLHASMRPIIILAQCFSLFPVTGVNTPNAAHLRFTWRSPKFIYCAISFFGSSIMTIFNVLRITSTGITSTKMTTFVFNGTNLIASFLFLKLAMQWPCLMVTWEKLEKELSTRHRKLSKTTLSTKFKIVTIVVMIFALVEHTFSILHGYIRAKDCAQFRGDPDITGVYFQSQFPQIFSRISYSLWKGILIDIINILSTFSWNFVDLFLILISIALADQFRQVNSRLYSIRGKAMPEWWWAEARTDYNHLANLTRQLDSHISIMVLLSFATDLYFICIQLLFSFKYTYHPMRGIIEKIYFGFSFGFLLARTMVVSLCAASIHDESLLPAPVLYSVSGSNFSTEVMRFLSQVTTDSICLTGMKFFSVTRSLVLTVAGTIVTYELVLVQFNSVQQNDTMNSTNVCESLALDTLR